MKKLNDKENDIIWTISRNIDTMKEKLNSEKEKLVIALTMAGEHHEIDLVNGEYQITKSGNIESASQRPTSEEVKSNVQLLID